ncbi:MAG TPA: hypothetical protein VM073_10410 [Usitatibacter sp.]|nr:hypothetical protein [Usitatibacter sp.]
MFDDLRNHDPFPTDEEQAWMAAGTLEVLLRSAAGVALALVVGMLGGYVNEEPAIEPALAKVAAR